jgi:hypothetical protein
VAKYKWNVKSGITDSAKKLAKEVGVTPVVAQVFTAAIQATGSIFIE